MTCVLRGLALALLAAAAHAAQGSRACSDACLDAARAERADCRASAQGVFLDTVTGCVERDVVCIDACRADRQDCRDGTSLGADRAACSVERAATRARCRRDHALEPRRLAICLGRADVANVRCRRDAIRSLRAELRACRAAFGSCAGACGPGGPAAGSQTCRAEGKAALRSAFDECRTAYRAGASGCIDRELGCLEDCGDARDACDAPALADLNAAIAACKTARETAVATCAAANPDGGPALDACLQAAAATAFQCREAAIEASLPAFATCTAAFAGCARTCPPAS